jgi:hypothetical protein
VRKWPRLRELFAQVGRAGFKFGESNHWNLAFAR